ncbi:trans-resveratrol di-O-methyltransferase-like [Coffea arabica]|uniref:Trans-resveratrol di-O-methyltransferase-like n=1 Tax=Coffea arabica TaxID=13443 RepID=A0ABM4X5G0_COFAR
MEKAENLVELIEAQTHVWNAMFHFKKSACLKCAVELGIPDVISNHGKPITLSDLISVLPIHPSKSAHAFRLMRFLANSGFFPWNLLTEWFQNDGPSPFDTAYGNNLWDYSVREVRFGNMFYEAVASDSQLSVEVLMTKCKFVFEGLTTFADVGGGMAKLLRPLPKLS